MPGRLSVIIPTRDRPDQLRLCILALQAVLRDGDELIVADSASTDDAVGRVAAELGAVVVRCDRKGASIARNAGAAAARHDLLAFVDDDVRVHGGWADEMSTALAGADFVCGAVGVSERDIDYERPVAVVEGTDELSYDLSSVGELGNSSNLGIRRDAFDAVGGFDEAIGAGTPFVVEDHDLFDRLLLAGRTGRFVPTVRGEHEQWRSRRDLMRLEWTYGLGSGARLSKLWRVDRSRFRTVARATVVSADVGGLAGALRQRARFGGLLVAIRLAATAVGLARFSLRRVGADGHTLPRRMGAR